MNTPQKLNHSSPIVQRVLRLRERRASVEGAQTGAGYQWQMWQKSDFSAYAGDKFAHSCKCLPPSQDREAEPVQGLSH
jgi:hypothetical protein